VLLGFDGYFPTDPTMKARMSEAIKIDFTRPTVEILNAVAKVLRCSVVYDPALRLPERLENERLADISASTVSAVLQVLAAFDVQAVPRGNTLVIAAPDTAAKISQQRHVFDWSELRLNRDEAQRVGDTLKVFFPPDCEINAATETFTIRGSEDAIPRAARILDALKPSEGGAIWPKTTVDLKALIQKLERPVSLSLNAEDPVNAVEILRAAGHDVYAVGLDDSKAFDKMPFPNELRAAAPVRLRLNDLPLACALAWVERRTRFATADLADSMLAYELSIDGRMQLQVRKKFLNPVVQAVLGTDVGFLYPKNARPNAAVDAEVKQKVLATLAPHLELFPTLNAERDVAVLRGRLFVQSAAPSLLYIQNLLRAWRATGQPEPLPAWRAKLEEKLNATHEWEGRGMTGGKVLPTLRGLGKINLLLEDAPDGTAAAFELSPQDAQLLPDGPQTLRALLSALAEKANAEWSVERGVIVVRPKKGARAQ